MYTQLSGCIVTVNCHILTTFYQSDKIFSQQTEGILRFSLRLIVTFITLSLISLLFERLWVWLRLIFFDFYNGRRYFLFFSHIYNFSWIIIIQKNLAILIYSIPFMFDLSSPSLFFLLLNRFCQNLKDYNNIGDI